MGGIQGSLNKQFALTIAIAMLISAFNALTLSPALAAMWLRPRREGRWTGGFFRWFNRSFDRASRGYVRASGALIRKAVLGGAILAGFTLLAAGLGQRLPTSFVPEEDYGYFMLNVQLPAGRLAAAHRRGRPQGREDPRRDGRHLRPTTPSSASAC